MSLNTVSIIGNLTRDPEMRYLPSGQAVTTFSIAVNRSYVAQTGEKKEDVSYVRIVTWTKLAEICNEYLKKGRQVFVEGRLQSRSWEAQDGSKRSTMEVVAQNVQFLSPRGSGSDEGSPMMEEDSSIFEGPSGGGSGSPRASQGDASMHEPEEEIPF